MRTITGTSHFVSTNAAIAYYKAYEGKNAKAAVMRKVSDGEIHIGKPALKAGDVLSVIPGEGRYQITSGEDKLTPLQASRLRESKLADGLRILASRHNVTFDEPLHIDSNGEFRLVTSPKPYGDTLVAILCENNPRCGTHPTRFLSPSNTWCRMNHFDVERMLSSQGLYNA